MEKNAKIYIAGHLGMVGSAILRNLEEKGYTNFLLLTHQQIDLTNQLFVTDFFAQEKPDYVFLASAKVGGIVANNTYPAQFFYENIMIETNVIHASYLHGVKKLMFLGSSCIYPKLAPQPMKEEALLTGLLETINEAYAIAKIAGIKMCNYYRKQYGCNYVSVMPTNLYGKGDNYDLQNSHVLPALIRKFHEAKINHSKEVLLWGTGSPLREFLYADDMADAIVFCMLNYNDYGHINVGSGQELTIKTLAEKIKNIVGYYGRVIWDTTKPDGTPRKLMDSSKLYAIGWSSKISLEQGIKMVYDEFISSYSKLAYN
ncbi:MAG: GDP-L-fucose synthase family protein [Chitinophagaceae bacterium]